MGPFLKDNEKSIGDTARLVADSAAGIRHNLDTLVKTAPAAAKGAHTASDALSAVYRARCETLPLPDAACPDLKKARQAAADVAEVADDVNTLIGDQNGDLDRLDKNLGTLQKQAQALADRSPHLSEDLTDAVSKVNKLNEGAEKVAAGRKEAAHGTRHGQDRRGGPRHGCRRAEDGREHPRRGHVQARRRLGQLAVAGCTTAPGRSPTTTGRTATCAPRSWPTR